FWRQWPRSPCTLRAWIVIRKARIGVLGSVAASAVGERTMFFGLRFEPSPNEPPRGRPNSRRHRPRPDGVAAPGREIEPARRGPGLLKKRNNRSHRRRGATDLSMW